MEGAYRLVDSASNVVSLNPDYDLRLSGKRQASKHRTRDGGVFLYMWSVHDRVKFKIEDVNSEDACLINSWWGGNVPLMLFDTSSTVVVSGYLVNAAKPIDGIMKPYTDQFKGVIELEGY